MLAKFRWGSKNGEGKMHWLSREKMATTIGAGEMGFCNINDSTLAYWVNTIGCFCLLIILLQKKCSKAGITQEVTLRISIGYARSFAQRSILSSRYLIKKETRWSICNGENVIICKDRWIPHHSSFKVRGSIRGLASNSKVSDLIDSDLGQWKRDLIFSSFVLEEVGKIVRTQFLLEELRIR